MNKTVGIILINYKDYAKRFLIECRDSIRKQDFSGTIKIYIVDNATSVDSENFLRNNYPEAKILRRQDGNYSAGNNLGIREGRKEGCDYFVIANMDTKFSKSWLSELVLAINSSEDIGIAQSKMLIYPKDKNDWNNFKINSTGNIMHYLGFGFTCDYKNEDYEIIGYPEIKGYASGCSFIIKNKILDKVGFYDEEYWMYHDDIELSWRVKLAGYKIILAPKSIVYHKYDFNRSILMLYYMERNRYLVMFHYYKLLTLLFIFPAILIMEIGMFFYSIPSGWFKTKIKVTGYFLKLNTWEKIIKKRKEVKKIRKLKDKDLIIYFWGKIDFQEINNPVLKYVANPFLNLYWQIVKKIIIW